MIPPKVRDHSPIAYRTWKFLNIKFMTEGSTKLLKHVVFNRTLSQEYPMFMIWSKDKAEPVSMNFFQLSWETWQKFHRTLGLLPQIHFHNMLNDCKSEKILSKASTDNYMVFFTTDLAIIANLTIFLLNQVFEATFLSLMNPSKVNNWTNSK